MKVLAFGEVLWDVFPDDKYIGGAPFNFAAHLAKYGEDVFLLSSVGNDSLGKETLSVINDFSVNSEFVAVSDKPTGRCVVTLDEKKVPSYDLKSDVAYDYIECYNLPNNFDVLYFGTLALRSEYNYNSLSSLLNANTFKEIFCDVNIRAPYYNINSVELCLKNATIIKISDEEMSVVAKLISFDGELNYKNFAKYLRERYSNLKLIIITLGENGSYCLDCKNNTEHSAVAIKVEVASTVGAGDSFSAAFLHKYLCFCNLDECINFASKVAAFVVSKIGAVPNYNPESI